MKNLAKLNGAKALSKNEQKSINGGKTIQTKPCNLGIYEVCPIGMYYYTDPSSGICVCGYFGG